MAINAQPIGVIARLLDLSERRIQQLGREGVIPKATRGQYDLVGSVRGYVAYLRDLAVKAQAGLPDFGAERTRLIRAKADIAEMDAQSRQGELLPAGAVEAAWMSVLARLRARLLVLPDRLADKSPQQTASSRSGYGGAGATALQNLRSNWLLVDNVSKNVGHKTHLYIRVGPCPVTLGAASIGNIPSASKTGTRQANLIQRKE